jgi:glycerophosphoryl diester phosphodiesterase
MIEIAHRGYSYLEQENTISSFKAAVSAEFDMIEADIQLCKSGEIIVYHNNYLDLELIKDLTFHQIINYNKTIIKIEDLFETVDINFNKIYLDLKGDEDLIEPLLKFIKSNIFNFNNLYIASFNRKHLHLLRKSNLGLKLGFITENNYIINENNKSKELDILLDGIFFIAINWYVLDQDVIDYCHSKNKKVYSYTLKNKNHLKHFLKFNIDGIITNLKIRKIM